MKSSSLSSYSSSISRTTHHYNRTVLGTSLGGVESKKQTFFSSSIANNNNSNSNSNNGSTEEDLLLSSFANLDHGREQRTGFPEAIFAQGKTPHQIATILDAMAAAQHVHQSNDNKDNGHLSSYNAILATRVDADLYKQVAAIPLQNGIIKYHETARIISMQANNDNDNDNDCKSSLLPSLGRVVVASAGTTDLYVAEEAAVTLEATGRVEVDRVYDAGVAGLHRIIKALPRLRHEDVKCILVCAGMDGALPSVVAGLVSVPVVAIPTSVGYGASFQGVSALLTMLNTCSPGVGVVNIDNGFGGAALAYKFLHSNNNNNNSS